MRFKILAKFSNWLNPSSLMKKGGTKPKPKDRQRQRLRLRSDSLSRNGKNGGRDFKQLVGKVEATDFSRSRSRDRSGEKHVPFGSKTTLIKKTASKPKTAIAQSSKTEVELNIKSRSKSKTSLISSRKKKSVFKFYNIDDDSESDFIDYEKLEKEQVKENIKGHIKPPKFTKNTNAPCIGTPPPSPTPLTDLILEKIQVQTFNCTKRSWKKPKEKDCFLAEEDENENEERKKPQLKEKGKEKSNHNLVGDKSAPGPDPAPGRELGVGALLSPINLNPKINPIVTLPITSHPQHPVSAPAPPHENPPLKKKSQTSVILIPDANNPKPKESSSKIQDGDKENKNPFQLPSSRSKWIAPHPKNYKSIMVFGMPRQRIEKAIREKRIFEIRGWVNNEVRECLIKRGWVEKPWSAPPQSLNKDDQDPVEKSEPSRKQAGNKIQINSNGNSKSKSVIAESFPYTKLLVDHPANLIWTDGSSRINWSEILPYQLLNRHPQAELVAKKNLVEPLQNIQWVGTEKNVSVQIPRAYRLYVKEERIAFLHDYRLTAVMSFLKWFVTSNELKMDENGTSKSKSKIYERKSEFAIHYKLLLDFSLAQISRYIRKRKHEDLDDHENDLEEEMKNDDDDSDQEEEGFEIDENENKDKDNYKTWSKITLKGRKEAINSKKKKKRHCKDGGRMLWEVFFEECYELTHRKGKFKCYPLRQLLHEERFKYLGEARKALTEVQKFWPQYHIDGMQNVWIFKPGNGTLGQGILVMDKYEEILKTFLSKSTKKSFWMAQKYIEKPYLISKAKFDIRQWFLISSWHPLTVWIYKKSYLRFSTKVFSLDDLHESIHLTNNSVQSRYDIDPGRGFAIPKDNMWTNDTFQAYLRRLGKPSVWKNIIYKGMKEAILGVLLAIQESIEHRPGSFHLMGADFMISDDFQPWLIEINSTPTFAHSTPVTTKLCPLCVQDTLKVILDWHAEKNLASKTGDFELLYQGGITAPSSQGLLIDGSENSEFCIQGRKAAPSLTNLQDGEPKVAPQALRSKSKMNNIKSFSVPDFTQGPSRKSSSSDSTLVNPNPNSNPIDGADADTNDTKRKESSDSFLPSGLKRAIEKYLMANNNSGSYNILK